VTNNNDDDHIVARLDERVSSLQHAISEMRDALHEYVRMERYLRVEIAVFGVIGIVMTAILVYVLNRVLHI
jgi:hypothetical protein